MHLISPATVSLSNFIAQIISITCLTLAIGTLLSTAHYDKVFKDFEKSPALTYMGGYLTLISGIIIVHYHNVWILDWTVFITLLGWLAIAKGVVLLAFPGSIHICDPLFKHPRYLGVATLILGLLFGYFGFFL